MLKLNYNLKNLFSKILNDYVKKDEIANNIYSTEETIIGTWINGKPVYRKVIVLPNLVDTPSNWTTIVNVASLNIQNIINSMFLDNNSKHWCGYFLKLNNGNLQAFGTNTTWNVKTIILEYTKIID